MLARCSSVLSMLLACGGVGVAAASDVPPPAPPPALDPAQNVASVASRLLDRPTFDHWMIVSAKASPSKSTGSTAVPAEGSARWRVLTGEVMSFLVTAAWVEGEAALQGVGATPHEVNSRFRKTKRQSFPKEAAYRRFLRRSGMTQQDVLYRTRLDLLSDRIRAKVVKGAATAAGKRRRLDRFVTDFQRRWKAQTTCATEFVTDDCANAPPG